MKLKRLVSIVLLCTLCVMSLGACAGKEDDTGDQGTELFTVTYKYNNGMDPYVISVSKGTELTPPAIPDKENYLFNGWYHDGDLWDFEEYPVFKDIVLEAEWLNASAVFDTVSNGDGTATITKFKGKMTTFRIPNVIGGLTVSAIGNGVFSGLVLAEVTLPDTITSIGASAFENCKDVKINISSDLTSLGDTAFKGCDKLSSISLKEGLDSVAFGAFLDCTALKTINLPNTAKVIEENAFDGCTALQTIVIGSTELAIEDSAFAGCTSLKTVFFYGNEQEWQAILDSVDNSNESNYALIDAKVYYYSESEPEVEGDFWYMTEKNEPRCW